MFWLLKCSDVESTMFGQIGRFFLAIVFASRWLRHFSICLFDFQLILSKVWQEFVRFDYSGHGSSDGEFEDGTIGAWKNDARDVLDHVVQAKDVILVGSSMGGWISLLLLLERADRVKGLVGIAAAPDFTREISGRLSDEQNAVMMRDGRVEVPNDYSDDPYVFTRLLITDGDENCLLDKTYNVDASMILVQGKQDADVPWEKALRIQECFKSPSSEVIFVDDGDHRLSKPNELEIIWNAVMRLSS